MYKIINQLLCLYKIFIFNSITFIAYAYMYILVYVLNSPTHPIFIIIYKSGYFLIVFSVCMLICMYVSMYIRKYNKKLKIYEFNFWSRISNIRVNVKKKKQQYLPSHITHICDKMADSPTSYTYICRYTYIRILISFSSKWGCATSPTLSLPYNTYSYTYEWI